MASCILWGERMTVPQPCVQSWEDPLSSDGLTRAPFLGWEMGRRNMLPHALFYYYVCFSRTPSIRPAGALLGISGLCCVHVCLTASLLIALFA